MGLLNRLPAPGSVFAGFLLEAEIGRGGAGAVFRARSPEGERYALKVLLRDLSQDRHRIRFEREALAGQELRHPGVIAVYGAGVEQGLGFMVMELLTGALPLDEYVAEHSLDLANRVRLLSEIATAVHAANQAGLIHRDLKPDNVLVTPDGKPKVVDFGLARHMDRERLTQSGATMGTLYYMAPEQIRGQTAHADARTDVYALGVMLYQLLTGKLPFTGDTAIEIMRAALENEPPSLPTEVSGMEPVIRLAMAKEPDQRYATAADFARDLHATGSSQGTAASGVLAARKRQRVTLTLAIALPLAAAAVGLVVYLLGPTKLPEQDLRQALAALRTSTSPVASSADQIEALPAQAPTAALSAEIAGWRALLAVARGQRPGDEPLGDEPLAWAVAGARGGDDAARDLTRAIRSGLGRADLYRWRALRADPQRDARQVLSDAQRWRQEAGLLPDAPDRALRDAEARAWIGQGELDRAAALVDASAPLSLRWELGLARANESFLRDAPAAWAALEPLAGEAQPPPSCAERAQALGERAKRELQVRARDGVSKKEESEARALLLLWRRLAPAAKVPPGLKTKLLHEVNGLKGPILLELALALGESFPDDLEVQRDLTATAGRLRKGAQRRLFPAIRRTIALELDGDERIKHQLTFAYLLAHVSEITEVEVRELESLVADVLPEVEDDKLKAVLLSARGRQYVERGDLRAAEVDLRDAVALDPAFAVARFMLAKLFQETKRHDLALAHYLIYLRGNERNGGRRDDALRYAWSRHKDPVAVKAVGAYLVGDPSHGGWQLRYAYLIAGEAPLEDLREICKLGATLLGKSPDRNLVDLSTEAAEVIELLARDEGRAKARELLTGIVAKLERLRKGKTFP